MLRKAFVAAGLAAAVLSACTPSDTVTQATCPRGGLVPDANTLVQFRDGPGRDLTDVVAQAQIVDFKITCEYATGSKAKPGVVLDLQVAIAAERGPADRARKANLAYFVAILDGEQNIVAKDFFQAAFEFPDNRTRVGRVEELEPRIALKSNFDGPSYRVMIGFQLTEDQLEWNRRQRGPR